MKRIVTTSTYFKIKAEWNFKIDWRMRKRNYWCVCALMTHAKIFLTFRKCASYIYLRLIKFKLTILFVMVDMIKKYILNSQKFRTAFSSEIRDTTDQ